MYETTWIMLTNVFMLSMARLSSRLLLIILALVIIFHPVSGVAAADDLLYGVGLMGDSRADEYQADDNRGGSYHDVTFNWLEMLARFRGVNFGSWGTWGGPRRTGYEYNWARSGATTGSLISDGQHTGLRSQVAAGKVTLAILEIGSNDFAPYNNDYGRIYRGELAGSALQTKLNQIESNFRTAISEVRKGGEVPFLVSSLADWNVIPSVVAQYPDPVGRQRVSDAINTLNQRIFQLPQSYNNLVVVDLMDIFQNKFIGRMNSKGNVIVGEEEILFSVKGNEPHHMQLNDTAGHAGTVSSGLYANYFFIEPVNQHFGTIIEPFSDAEILWRANIGPPLSGTPTVGNWRTLLKNWLTVSGDLVKDGKVNSLDWVSSISIRI